MASTQSFRNTADLVITDAPNCWGCDRIGDVMGPEGFKNPQCLDNRAARVNAGLEQPNCGRVAMSYTVVINQWHAGTDTNNYPITRKRHTLTDINIMPLGGVDEVLADVQATYGKSTINALGSQNG